MRMVSGVVVLGLAMSGCGGGGGNSAGAGAMSSGTSTGDSTGGTTGGASGGTVTTPHVVQANTTIFQTPGADGANDVAVSFNTATTAGDVIWVAVTVSDFAGAHAITVTDSQNNTYTALGQPINDPSPGDQTVAQFYAPNIHGDATTPDTVTVHWGNDNYKGVLLVEIAGVTATPLVGQASNQQDALPRGTNNVTAGPMDVSAAQTPALVVALSMNTSGGNSDIGGSHESGPTAGTGFTQISMLWDWEENLATFATASITSAESVTSVFNAPGTDNYVTVAAVFH